jgi:6-pyruvoyltetrahydropterin/6-carboxytetrahydropterin synthase
VALEGEALNSIGLLYDFKDLKEAIHCVINRLDHRFLNEIPPFDELNPSAENLAKHFYEEITRMLPSVSDSAAASQYPAGASCRVERVTVWEADDTTATYFANGSRGNGAPDPE